MKSVLLALSICFAALPASAQLDDVIQFMGLITFVAPESGVEAILPRFNGDDHIAAHDSLILFKAPPDKIENWPMGTISIFNYVTSRDETWYYVELHSDTVTFDREALPKVYRPTFMPRLNDGCCGWIIGLDDDYEKHGKSAAAHVVLPNSTLGVGQDPKNEPLGRFDVVARFAHRDSLTITATLGQRKRKLTFETPAKIVIANFPVALLRKPEPVPDDRDHDRYVPHFKVYYKMANLGGLCSDDRIPSERESCKPSPKNDQIVDLILAILERAPGTDINCSNSTYP